MNNLLCDYLLFIFLGNFLILTTIFYTKKLRKVSSNLIIANLSIAHLCVSSIVNTFTLIDIFNGREIGKLISAVCLISDLTALENVALLAVDRYNEF